MGATKPDLTPGEYAAVERLARGESQAEAAAALGTSRKTVEHQIASARRRWGCRTAAQLLFEFGRRGP